MRDAVRCAWDTPSVMLKTRLGGRQQRDTKVTERDMWLVSTPVVPAHDGTASWTSSWHLMAAEGTVWVTQLGANVVGQIS